MPTPTLHTLHKPQLALFSALFSALFLALSTLPAQAAADERLLAAARAAEPALVQSLKDMVSIESGTVDKPGLTQMSDYAEARLRALGMAVERRPSSTQNLWLGHR